MNKLVIITILSFILPFIQNLEILISDGSEQCFVEELYQGHGAIFKYKVYGLKGEPHENQSMLSKIEIKIFNEETHQFIHRNNISVKEGSIPFTTKHDGYYIICVNVHSSQYWYRFPNVSMKVQILSDNMDEPDLKKALKVQEVGEVHEKLRYIITVGKNSVDGQKLEMNQEDSFAVYVIENTKILYYLSFFQILIIVTVGVYQIFSFRKYLSSHHII